MEQKKIRFFIIIGIAVLVVLGIAVTLLFQQQKPTHTIPTEQELVGTEQQDPVSGETYYSGGTINSTVEDSSIEPLYLGFSKLINLGLSQEQITSTKNTISSYMRDEDLPKELVSIYKDSATSSTTKLASGNQTTISFKIQLNKEKDLLVELKDITVSNIRVVLKDNSGEVYNIYY